MTEPKPTDSNPYDDDDLAQYYAGLDYGGTYLLAIRDLPAILAQHVTGRQALDFACGSGRSTRFLKSLAFDVIGVDISSQMLARARSLDPIGQYLAVGNGDLSVLGKTRFDLVLAAFPFDSVTSRAHMQHLLTVLRERLAADGRLVLVGSTPELYRNEWLSFTTDPFPENLSATSGQPVRIAFRDRPDEPVNDLLWADMDYHTAYAAAGLQLLEAHRPLIEEEPGNWISETTIAPWRIDVLGAG